MFNFEAALKARYAGKVPNTTTGFDVSEANNVQLQADNASGTHTNYMIPVDSAGFTALNNASGVKVTGPIADSGGTNKIVLNPTAKAISNASATSLADIACASNSYCSGAIVYNVQVTNGTDYQSLSGVVTYAAVNKGGTLTLAITEATGNQAKAVSAGTLTLAWTFVTGTNKGTIKLQTTTSLTATVNQVIYTVLPVAGAVTIL